MLRLMKKVLQISATFVAVITLNGCQHAAPVASASDQAESGTAYDYRIGQGDLLNIFVWRNPDLSVSGVPVRPDGKVSVPLVQEIVAAGKTPQQLSSEIQSGLTSYIKEPLVTVTVMQFQGATGEFVRIAGQVTTPQAIAYRRNMTVLDLLIAAGGMTEFASGNRATLVRTAGGKQQAYRVRLSDLVDDGDISANMALQPGDIVIVPETLL
ncbi:MAG: XrtA/PEP-CTERM system exopolysaccharide export protein [Gammaproteobacteria bacterium]